MSIVLDLDSDADQVLSSANSEAPMCDISESKTDENLIQITTKTRCKRMSISWDIDEQSLMMARSQRRHRDSSVISATIARNGMQFKLELCTIGWKSSQPGYCAFYLTIPNSIDENGTNLVARYNITVGDIIRRSSIRSDFNLGVGFPNFCQQDALFDYLILNSKSGIKTITFNIDFELLEMYSTTINDDTCMNNNNNNNKNNDFINKLMQFDFDSDLTKNQLLSQLVQKIYNNLDFADITMKCRNEEEIKVHKIVLCSVSPMFKNIFSHEFMEQETKEIDMTHWNTNVVKSFVNFIYNARIEIPQFLLEKEKSDNSKNMDITMNENKKSNEEDSKSVDSISNGQNNKDNNNSILHFVFELFQMAEFYQIESLIQACCVKLCEQVNVYNAFTLLETMNRLQLGNEIEKIREKIWEYILQHAKDVPKEKIFEYPHLVSEMIQRLTTKK